MADRVRLKRILVTNDDGIDAAGLAVAEAVAADFADEVWSVAPATNCSGMSRQISLMEPLRLIEHGERRFAVTGSPADSVALGLRHVLRDNPPDLVISGVNAGANISRDIGYSGTVGAALTAQILGFPAIATSQRWYSRENMPWNTSRHWIPLAMDKLLADTSWTANSVMNINMPAVEPDQVTGIEATRPGAGSVVDFGFDRRIDHREREYFWLSFKRTNGEDYLDADVSALDRAAVSISPVRADNTDMEALADLRTLLA